MARRTSRYGSAARSTPAKQTPKTPTIKQMQSVHCPACNAPAGTPCTLQGGHRARADAYRATTTSAVPTQEATPVKAKATAGQSRPGARSCAICRKPLGKQPTVKAKSGKTCHSSCLKQATAAGTPSAKPTEPRPPRQWDTKAAERAFAKNKAAVESGRTFRAQQSSGWKLGGSPSTAGETTR